MTDLFTRQTARVQTEVNWERLEGTIRTEACMTFIIICGLENIKN